MTLLLYILALVCFLIAVLMPGPIRPTEARLRLLALGLVFWLLPALLLAARVHIS